MWDHEDWLVDRWMDTEEVWHDGDDPWDDVSDIREAVLQMDEDMYRHFSEIYLDSEYYDWDDYLADVENMYRR